MKIVTVSDIHRASDPRVDNFGLQKEKVFLKFLREIASEADLLLILGDKDELWQGEGWSEKRRLKLIYKRYWRTEKALEELRRKITVQTLPGNHDWLLKSLYKLPEEFILVDNNWKLVFLHGHQFDEQYKDEQSALIGRVATEIWGVAEGVFGKDNMSKILPSIENWIERQKIKRMQPASVLPDESYIQSAIEHAKKRKADVIVMGHTHKPKIERRGNITYVNTGTWIDDRFDFVAIDTKTREILLSTFI